MERKLAAILSADVVGYSRLMGADENATFLALRSHREIMDSLIGSQRGRVFYSAGDSVVAEFPSAVEACLCAIEIQQALVKRNEAVPLGKRLQFRIGINIGDVVVEGSNLFGDGVNIADRVQTLADPGGHLRLAQCLRSTQQQGRIQAGADGRAQGQEYCIANQRLSGTRR